MMEEIITLMIHEATEREGLEMIHKLNEVRAEINLIIEKITNDLRAIKRLEIHETRKAEMVTMVLTSHKT